MAVATKGALKKLVPAEQTFLSRRELDILGQLLLGVGASVIAEEYHVKIETIMRLVRSDRFQLAKSELERKALENRNLGIAKKVHESFEEASPTAADRIINLAETAGNEGLKFEASKEILDRAGFQVVRKQETKHLSFNVSDKMLESLIKAIEGHGKPDPEKERILDYVESGKGKFEPSRSAKTADKTTAVVSSSDST